jgi:hypothetical protein
VDPLCLETFAPLAGSAFSVGAGGHGVSLELVEVNALRSLGDVPRAPFSLLFAGPQEPLLPQATYTLTHAQLGDVDIFIVPVSQDAGGVRYEAIFA